MMTFEFTNGLVFEAVRTMVGFVGGVTPPPGVPPGPTGGGAVGDSLLHPVMISSSSARSANVTFRCLMSIIRTPVNSSIHPIERLETPTAREAEIKCHSRAAGNAFPGKRCSKQLQSHVQRDDWPSCFRIASAVLRLQSCERRQVDSVGVEERKVRPLGAPVNAHQR